MANDLPPIQPFTSKPTNIGEGTTLPPIQPFEASQAPSITPTAAPTSSGGLPPIQDFEGNAVPDESTRKFPTDDPNMPWYERAWDWANAPLLNINSENKGGFVGGTEDVLSGLTSPLSIGLTAATFGVGPLLRGLGLAAEELPVAVRGLKALVDVGFTAQGAVQAAKESPRVLDALKEGDYDTAKRLAVHVLAGGAVTYLGGRHIVGEDLPLLNPVLEKAGFSEKFRFSEENQKLRRLESVRQRGQQISESIARNIKDAKGKEFKDLSDDEHSATMPLMQAGLDPAGKNELIYRRNLIARSMGKEEIPGGPENGQKVALGDPEQPNGDSPIHVAARLSGSTLYPVLSDGKKIGLLSIVKEGDKADIGWLGSENPTKEELESGRGPLTGQVGPAALRQIARQFKADNPEIKTITGMRIGGKATGELRPVDISIDKVIGDTANLPHPEEAHTPEESAKYGALADQQKIKETYTPEEQDRLLRLYDLAINPTPRMLELAKWARDEFSKYYELGHAKGMIGDAFKHYITQIWEKDPDNPAANRLMHDVNAGYFDTRVSFGRKRMFKNAFEGQLLGRKLAEDKPINLISNYISKMGESVANRDMLESITGNHGNISPSVVASLKNFGLFDKYSDAGLIKEGKNGNYNWSIEGLRASDGRPATALSGTGQIVEDEGKSPAGLLNPDRIRNIRIGDEKIEELKQSGQLDKFIADKTILEGKNKAGEPVYSWSTQNYKTIDHSAFSGWNWGANAPDGTPLFVKGELRVHPEFYDYLKKLIAPEKTTGVLGAALKVGSTLKHTILSLSPFHIMQEGLRAVMTGINPFKTDIPDIANDKMLQFGVEHSLTLLKDRHSESTWLDGLSSGPNSLLKNIPLVKDVQSHLQSFLFDKYIPSLKGRAFKALFAKYAGKLNDADAFSDLLKSREDLKGYKPIEAAARLAAEDTNERFGGLNYRQFGRSAATQDFLRLATLAPDWLESEMRFTKRLFTPGAEGSIARTDFVKMAAIMWGASRILNLITSGKPHLEAPFGVAHVDDNGNEKIYSVRTLPTDIMHAISDPEGFLKGRISPLGRIADEVYSQRDAMGRKQTGFGTAVDIARNVLPIPAQAITGAITGQSPELGNFDQGMKAVGGTAQVYRTAAQTKAAQLASDKSESGPVDPAQLRKHQALMEFEDRVRSGKMPITDIHTMVEQGSMPVKDAKTIMQNVKETQGMDPELARLYSRASRLPMRDFLQVYDLADNDEKMSLVKLLLKKKAAYFKTAAKDLTPQERQSDPTYQRLRKLFPQSEPW